MKLLAAAVLLSVALASTGSPNSDAPTGFDNKGNGMVDDTTHQADQEKFDDIETVADGLGPLYNAQSCRECHQNPTSGGTSQVAELRVGHQGSDHLFHNAEIPIAHGAEVITGRTLVNDRSICPNAASPDTEIQEHVPNSENIRTTRISLGVLGDGFVEAVADETLVGLAQKQCKESHHKICGQVIYVPIVEAPGQTGVGRFGWKDQHASLLSFSGDAYLNEIGITTRLFPDEVTKLCNTAPSPTIKRVPTVWTMLTILPDSSAPPKPPLAILSWRTPGNPKKGTNCLTRLAAPSAMCVHSRQHQPAQRSTEARTPFPKR